MGYAAGHKAGILVWVAPKFWEYHQRLLGWLKESMAGNREIYAVEVSLVPGGDLHPVDADEKASSFRPVFSKLPLHNDWPDWPVQTAEEQSEAHHRYRAFFQPIIGKLRRSGVTDRVDALARKDHGFPSGLPGISYHIGFWGGIAKPSLDVYLWIATDDKDRNKEIFDALHQRRGEIEAELAGVSWDRRNNQRMCSIYFTESGSIADAEERLVELRDWAPDRLIALKAAFQPRLEEVMPDCGAGRATRRVGRSPPLPCHPQRRRQRCAARAQHAGRSGLINIKRDDALLHYLYVAVAPWIGRSAGRARGARRSLLGEPGHNPGLHRRQVGHPSRRSGRSERIQGL